MADFPVLPTLARGSRERWRDPSSISLSRANTIKKRMSSAGRKLDLILALHLKSGNYETLKAFYDANRDLVFTYHYEREVAGVLTTTDHEMIFGPNNIELPIQDVGAFTCSLELWEV